MIINLKDEPKTPKSTAVLLESNEAVKKGTLQG